MDVNVDVNAGVNVKLNENAYANVLMSSCPNVKMCGNVQNMKDVNTCKQTSLVFFLNKNL